MNTLQTFVQSGILEATWAERVGWALLHSLWQIALIAGVYALVAALLRKRSAQARYLCGCAAMLLMLVAPVATWLVLPDGDLSAVGKPEVLSVVVPGGVGEAVDSFGTGVAPLADSASDPPVVVPAPELGTELRGVAGAPEVPNPDRFAALRRWLPRATVLWLAGVCLLSLRPVVGWMHVRRLQRHGLSPLSASLGKDAAKLAARLGVTRAVQFVQSTLVEVPTVVGSLRPFVLLPASAVSGLSVAQIEMILAHELAHIRRHDYLVNLAQTVIEALLFFHPAMWWVSRQVRRERENCCDDVAVEVSGNREHYVQALTRIEEQRAASSVAALAATGGSLLERVRRLLGQPGAEFGYRSATAWLAGLLAIGLVSLALATGGAPEKEGGEASAEDVEDRETTPVPIEHEAVLVVREHLKAIDSGDYDRAIGLGTPGEFKREGLVKVAESYDLSKADIAEALVGSANAAVLTKRLAARAAATPGQFGFSLVPIGDQWRIRDVDFLPDDKAVKGWLAEFGRLEPDALPAEAGPRSGDQQSDREAMLAYARALAAGDFKKLKQTWEFQDDLDRQFAQMLAGMFARAEEMTVELVAMRSMDDDSLFACFLMRDGPEPSGPNAVPSFTTFHRKDGRWRCAPPQDLRTMIHARTMGAKQFGRRNITQQMIAARFNPDYLTKRLAYTKAQREAFARLARPPYMLDHFGMIAEQMTASLAKMEAMKTESWRDLWRLTLEEHGEEALPRPGDFYLRFHLEAAKDDAHARKIPMADGSPDILVEPFPCLTEDHVLWAGVSKGPAGPNSQVTIMLTKGGAEIFLALTRESIGKRVAIMIDDQVVTAPVIRTAIGGKAMISGNFSREEAEAIAEKLNSFRKEAEKLFDEFEKEPAAGDEDTGVPKSNPQEVVNRIVQELLVGLRHKHPELARFGEALRHEVDAWNGVIRVSLAYEHNYLSVTKGKPAGPKEANKPWCRISLRIGPVNALPWQLKRGAVEAGQEIRWNGKSDARRYRLGDPPLIADVSVETGSDALRRDVNRIIDRELTALISGTDKNEGATENARPDGSAGLEFLDGIPEFRELRLKMSEAQLREIIHRHSLTNLLAASRDDSGNYHLFTRGGENVIVMFRDGECGGIQRMRPDRDTAEKLFLAHGNAPDPGKKPLPPDFSGVTAITFHNDLEGDRFVKVTKPEDVRRLILAIQLTPKEPCECEHMWSATFHKEGAETKVAICDHCFDIQGAGAAKHFSMSPEFFRLFAKHTGWPEEAGDDDTPGPAGDKPDATGRRPRAVSDPVEIVTATKEDGETSIELRKCLRNITTRIGKMKGQYRELEGLDDVKLGGSVAADPDNLLHLGFEYSHRFDGWDKNKHSKIGDGGCMIAVRFGSPDNPSSMMSSVPLPRFGKLEARYLVLGGEGGPAGKFHQAVTVVIIEELGKLRDGGPGVSWGKPSDGVRARIVGAERLLSRPDWGHPVLRLSYEVKNEGTYILHLPENGLDHQVEVDGQWYEWVDPPRAAPEEGEAVVSERGGKLLDFGPGGKHAGQKIEVAGNWRAIPKGREEDYGARWYADWAGGRDDDHGKELVLTPGPHQVRVAVICPSARAPFHGVIRAVSSPVEVEIGAPKVFADPNSKHDGVIRGRVIDPCSTRPGSDYHVTLWHPDWERNTGEAPALVVKAGEQFEFRNLPAGDYEIRAREWRPKGRVVNWHTEWTPIVVGTSVGEGKVAEVELVFQPDETGRWSEAHTWGEAVDGVMMCITKSKFTITPGEELDLRVEIHNGSKTDRRIALEHDAWELEVNGKWLKPSGGVEGRRRHLPLPAKQAQHQLEVWPWLWENMTAAIKELPPGKHTIRVARLLNGDGRSAKDPPQIRIVSQPVTVEVVAGEEGEGKNAAADNAGLPPEILPILRAMKQEVVKLGEEYPQLAGAKTVEATPDGWLFEHDCRFMGKRGYEHTGPFPVAIGFRIMTAERFAEQADKVAMSNPGYRWDYLGLVGWPTLHVGEGVAPGLTGKLQQVLRNVMAKIGPLNRKALADSLPEGVAQERNRLLAEADAKIRDGVRKLAEAWPLLKKGQSWERLARASDPGTIGIGFRRTQPGGKGGTDERAFPPSEAFSILVVVKLPPDEIEQLSLRRMYPRLGLVGQVGTRAANPDLDVALKKLVTDALAPLHELEKRAGPPRPAPATPDYRRGKAEAEVDLKAGRARYFHVGQPLSADSPLAGILRKDYGLKLVGLGCSPVPPVGEHAKGYNETIVRELGKKFGPDFIKKAWEKDRALREGAGKPKGPGKEAAPGARATGDDPGPQSVEAGQAVDDPMPFEELKVVMRCSSWGTRCRELTIGGDGRATFAMVTHQDETKYRAEFRLSDGQRRSLTRCLEATRWLEQPPEEVTAIGAVGFEVELHRKGRTKRAEFVVQRQPPYESLEMFLKGLDRQEYLFYQLTASTKDHRLDAAREIQNELSARMKRPGHRPAAHRKDLDFTRFVPVLIPWLKDRRNHGTNEMTAAIDLVGYLKLADQREAVEGLMGLSTYNDWNSVCECLARLGDPRSIPVLKERAMKPGADAPCWALIRMGAPAHDAICEVLRTPDSAYKMVRVYLRHFQDLPEPVAPAIVEAIRAARLGRSPIRDYADELLGFIEGVNPVLDLWVTIAPEKTEYAEGEPVLVKWKIENKGNAPRTILWHPLHYSPVVFSFMTAGGTEYDRADRRRHIVDELPAPPEPLVLQPGESHETNIDLRHFLPDGTSTWVIAGYYWPKAKEAAIPAGFLDDPKFTGAVLDRIGSKVARIVVLREPRTAEEEQREAERLKHEDERLAREEEEAKRRAIEKQARDQRSPE